VVIAAGESQKELYKSYRREIESDALARALYRAVIVLFVINTVFIAVDRLVYPERFWAFLPVRIGLDAILAFLYAVTVRRFPVSSTLATSAAGGWMLFTVVSGTGGAASDYYVGLVLLLIGIGVLVPLSARQGTLAISVLFGCYVGLALLGEGSGDLKRLSLSLFFLGAAAFVGIMSCAYLDRMRFADFVQRREIEKARDELRELDVAKSRFTANIHHELRTPLTLTLAPVEAMLAGEFGELTQVQRSYLETIRGNGLRLLKLINNLLDLAKIESRQLEIERRPIRAGEVAEEIVSGARPLAERKGIRLALQGFEDDPTLCADPEALEKILVNLIGNALKFTDAGGSIEVRASVPEAGGLHLVVADTGIGIPPDQLDRVFDRFAQVDGSSTRRHEGTGIGLSLVKELVELHGGRVWVESEGLGQGAQMHVVLPPGESDVEGAEEAEEAIVGGDLRASSLAAMSAELDVDAEDAAGEEGYGDDLRLAELRRNVERAEAEERARGEASAADPGDERSAEVLIVEDNPDMRKLLADLVGREYRVRVARNGREGLERVREQLPDLVLTDVMMPEMSGTELCAAIKGDPATSSVPVVLVTSKAEREMKIEGLELGADDYVTKPFHPRELLARVRSLVRLRRVQAELAIRNALLESTNEELQSTMLELREAGAQLVQAERLAAVGELAAGVAHEVNNPVNFALNAIKTLRIYVDDIGRVARQIAALDADDPARLGYQLQELDALREQLQFDEAADALNELGGIVAEGLERTSRLVGDLRDFAAPGDQRTGDVDLARGLRSTLQLVSHTLAEARVEARLELPETLPAVEGDARALNQVFLNLLKNAAEAFDERGGQIHVRAVPEGDSILVEIRDDGPGIAAELQARVFEPFFSTKEAGRGSGLGLSISRRIVSEHGGSLELVSEPGAGCCFRMRLPTRERASVTSGDAAQVAAEARDAG
jgi:signal transduction histidine kinase